MRNINYSGFSGTQSTCGYGSAMVNNTIIMIFEHKQIGTSPQNVIEELTTEYYNNEYQDVKPTNLRVFEADFGKNALSKYQEVTFSNIESNKKSGMHERWNFSDPGWNPVSKIDEQWLDSMIANKTI